MPDVLLMTVYQCPPFPFVASSRATQIPVAVGGSVQRNAESCAGDLLTSGTPSQSLVGAQSIRRYSTKSSYGVPAVVASVTLRCQQLGALQLMQRAHLMRNHLYANLWLLQTQQAALLSRKMLAALCGPLQSSTTKNRQWQLRAPVEGLRTNMQIC